MEKLIALLGLAPDTTVEEFAKMHTTLVDECLANDAKFKYLENALKIANEQIEAITADNEQLIVDMQKYQELAKGKTDKSRQFDDKNDAPAEPFKNGKPLSEKKLKELAADIFKANENAEKVYVTQDGECFMNPVHANNHRRAIGGRLLTFYKE